MTWEPQPEGLQQMIAILKQSQSPDTATQMAVQVVSAHTLYFTTSHIGLVGLPSLFAYLLWLVVLFIFEAISTPVVRS